MQQAARPPRVELLIKGVHVAEDGPTPVGPNATNSNLSVDISQCFQPPARTQESEVAAVPWHTIKLPPPQIEAFWGGIIKHAGTSELDATPDLETWCHRYITQVKRSAFPCEFVLKRKPRFMNTGYVVKTLEQASRRTNYAGKVITNLMWEVHRHKSALDEPGATQLVHLVGSRGIADVNRRLADSCAMYDEIRSGDCRMADEEGSGWPDGDCGMR